MTAEELAAKLEESLCGDSPTFTDRPEVGPTRRLRLREEREKRERALRPSILRELITVAYEAVQLNWADMRERETLVKQLRALARRIEEGP